MPPGENPSPPHAEPGANLALCARVVLVPVAAIGAVLSFQSLYRAATPTFGQRLSVGFPCLVDLLILGSSLQYVAGAKAGHPREGWRITALAGVAGTILLNALTATRAQDIPWHIVPAAVWAVLVELAARQALGTHAPGHLGPRAAIPIMVWVLSPWESTRIHLHMLRTGIVEVDAGRAALGSHTAAREWLRIMIPRKGKRVRRIILAQLRAGNLPPSAILEPIETGAATALEQTSQIVLQTLLRRILATPGSCEFTPENLANDHGALTSQPSETLAHASVDVLDPEHDGLTQSTVEPSSEKAPHRNGHTKGGPGAQDADHDPEPGTRKEPPEETIVDTAGGAPPRLDLSVRRAALSGAVAIVQENPRISAPQLRKTLQAQGWTLSDRTASRLLADALDRAKQAARESATTPSQSDIPT